MKIKIWKDKNKNWITAKEFFSRFSDGVKNITPVQKIKNESRATFTMFIGYLVGLVSLIIYRKLFVVQWFTYALIIIFLGASWSNAIKWFVLRQQVKLFSQFDTNAIDLNKIMDSLEEVKEDKVVVVDSEEKKGMSEMGIDMENYVDENIQKAKDREMKGGNENEK